MRHMKKVAAVLVVSAAACISASAAQADTAFVSPFKCAVTNGGQATVPAGSTVTIRQRFAETRRGVLVAWLNAQTTSLSVNGGPTLDLTGDWTAPEQRSDGSWISSVAHDTGITLGAGESLTFTFEIALSNPVPEVLGGAQPEFNPAGSQGVWSCTVTGV
ncbi:MAG TPA: hypothetical protein VF101_09395 [Gaiellaceae bacterium]